MPPVAIAAGIGGIASIAGSILSGKPKTTTQNVSQNSTSSSTGTSTSSSTPTFSPQLQGLMGQLGDYATNSMNNPTAMLAPIRNAGLSNINQEYAGVPQQVTQQLASRGFGSSGATGEDLYTVANAKSGAQASLEGQLAQLGVQQSQFGASLGEQLLNTGKGTTSTTTGSSSTTGSSTGTATTTGPNTMAANGLSSLGAGLTSAAAPGSAGWLAALLGGGGGGDVSKSSS